LLQALICHVLFAVPKVVEIADPLIKTSVKTYGSVHDTVVVSAAN
jgi:hypothetical protein